MLLPGFLRALLFLHALLYASFVVGQNDDEQTPDGSGSTTVENSEDQTTTSEPQTTRVFKAFFARDPPKPAQSDTAETSTTMAGNDEKGVAINDGANQNTTPSPSSSTASTNSPAQAPVFFARDPPGPSQSSEPTEMPESDDERTKPTEEPETSGDSARSKESDDNASEDPDSNDENVMTTKAPKLDTDPSMSNRRNIIHVRPVKQPRYTSGSHPKQLHGNYIVGFGQLSTNHKSFIEPPYHVQILNSGVAIPVSPEDTTTYKKKAQRMTTVAPSALSKSSNADERSSQAMAIQSTILKFLVDALKKLHPIRNIRRAFDMRHMSPKTLKTLIYGIVFHFPDGTEVPDAENTCKVLDRALSDNFERVRPLNNSLMRILTSAAAKFLMFRKVLSPHNEGDLADWFAKCFKESLGDVHHPTEEQSMFAIGDGFVNFLDSMDLYLPSATKFLAKYISDGLYAVL